MNRRNFLGITGLIPVILAKPAWLSNRNFLDEVLGITTTHSFLGDFWLPYKTVYKVTKPNGESFSSNSLPSSIVLQYAIGLTVNPKVGKIFTFDNIEDAKAYGGHKKIFLCKTKHYEKGKMWYGYASRYDSIECVKDKWKNKHYYEICLSNREVIYCDSLQVIKEIK